VTRLRRCGGQLLQRRARANAGGQCRRPIRAYAPVRDGEQTFRSAHRKNFTTENHGARTDVLRVTQSDVMKSSERDFSERSAPGPADLFAATHESAADQGRCRSAPITQGGKRLGQAKGHVSSAARKVSSVVRDAPREPPGRCAVTATVERPPGRHHAPRADAPRPTIPLPARAARGSPSADQW
jgi:hypothetical protein